MKRLSGIGHHHRRLRPVVQRPANGLRTAVNPVKMLIHRIEFDAANLFETSNRKDDIGTVGQTGQQTIDVILLTEEEEGFRCNARLVVSRELVVSWASAAVSV